MPSPKTSSASAEFYIYAIAIYEGIDRPPRSSFEARKNARTTFIRLLVANYRSLWGFRVWNTDSLEDWTVVAGVCLWWRGGGQEGRVVVIGDVENEETGGLW